jgi:hypothetical protein
MRNALFYWTSTSTDVTKIMIDSGFDAAAVVVNPMREGVA